MHARYATRQGLVYHGIIKESRPATSRDCLFLDDSSDDNESVTVAEEDDDDNTAAVDNDDINTCHVSFAADEDDNIGMADGYFDLTVPDSPHYVKHFTTSVCYDSDGNTISEKEAVLIDLTI
jgi:hypothetical protein